MSNISQGTVGSGIKRKVVSMSKRHVVEIYSDNTLEQYFPAKKVVMISKVSRAGFPNIFFGDASHIINYYDFFRKTELDDVIVKKQTQAYEIVPKDKLRWKLRLWIDSESALPISVEYINSGGSVIKREAFTSLNIGLSDVDMDSTIASGKTWRKFFVSRYKNEKKNVFYEEPVEGFRLVNCFDSKFHRSGKMSSNSDYNQNHCLFSDGVAHVSLVAFYERESNVYFRVGNWTKGCSSFKSGIVSNRSVISFGCVPKETVQVFFNNSVAR
jgi:sigma-E factor negative regulatory protein RseB